MTVEDKLDIMDGFTLVTPMLIKSGAILFRCNCPDSNRKYAYEQSREISMLWILKLYFPEVESRKGRATEGQGNNKGVNSFRCCSKAKDEAERREATNEGL